MTIKQTVQRIAQGAGLVAALGTGAIAGNASAQDTQKGMLDPFALRTRVEYIGDMDQTHGMVETLGIAPAGKYNNRTTLAGQCNDMFRWSHFDTITPTNHYDFTTLGLRDMQKLIFSPEEMAANALIPTRTTFWGGFGDTAKGEFTNFGAEAQNDFKINKETALDTRLTFENVAGYDNAHRVGFGLGVKAGKFYVNLSNDHIFRENAQDSNQVAIHGIYDVNEDINLGGAFLQRNNADGSESNLVRGVFTKSGGEQGWGTRTYVTHEWNPEKDFKQTSFVSVVTPFGASVFGRGSTWLVVGTDSYTPRDLEYLAGPKNGFAIEGIPEYDRLKGSTDEKGLGFYLTGNKTHNGFTDSLSFRTGVVYMFNPTGPKTFGKTELGLLAGYRHDESSNWKKHTQNSTDSMEFGGTLRVDYKFGITAGATVPTSEDVKPSFMFRGELKF